MLLILAGIEQNPGPKMSKQTTLETSLDRDKDIKDLINALTKRLDSWGERLESRLPAIDDRVENINQRLQQLEESSAVTKAALSQNSKKIKDLEDQLEHLDAKSRERNLIFYGIEQDNNEDCRERIRKVIEENMQTTEKINITRCHRLSRKPGAPILIEVPEQNDRLTLFKAALNLRGTKISLSKDYSMKMREQRRVLNVKRRELVEKGTLAKLRDDKFLINGIAYKPPALATHVSHLIQPPALATRVSHLIQPPALATRVSHLIQPPALATRVSHLIQPPALATRVSHLIQPPALATRSSHLIPPTALVTRVSHLIQPPALATRVSHLIQPPALATRVSHLIQPPALATRVSHLIQPPALATRVSHLIQPPALATRSSHLIPPTALVTRVSHLIQPPALATRVSHLIQPPSLATRVSHLIQPPALATRVSHLIQPPALATRVSHLIQPPALATRVSHLIQPPALATRVSHLIQPPALATRVSHLIQPPALATRVSHLIQPPALATRVSHLIQSPALATRSSYLIPPTALVTRCTTSRAYRQIVRMAVTDRSVTLRTVAQHIQSVTHHPVSARTIRRRLQQSGLSARRPLLRLPLTQNHRRLRRQWCDERRMWTAEWSEIVFYDGSRSCLQHQYGRIRVRRHRGERILNRCIMHRRTGPAPGIMLSFLTFGACPQPYFNRIMRPHVVRIVQRFFVNRQIELLPWPARSPDLSPIENMWSMVAQRLTQITSPAATPDEPWQRVEAAWSAVLQEHIQSPLGLAHSSFSQPAGLLGRPTLPSVNLQVPWASPLFLQSTCRSPDPVHSSSVNLEVPWAGPLFLGQPGGPLGRLTLPQSTWRSPGPAHSSSVNLEVLWAGLLFLSQSGGPLGRHTLPQSTSSQPRGPLGRPTLPQSIWRSPGPAHSFSVNLEVPWDGPLFLSQPRGPLGRHTLPQSTWRSSGPAHSSSVNLEVPWAGLLVLSQPRGPLGRHTRPQSTWRSSGPAHSSSVNLEVPWAGLLVLSQPRGPLGRLTLPQST
ncbi:hypothetical protein LAZ67_17001132 [Cordylochernes scorpioides]|uniref:Transposase Tc1-like domain-containing protein n=1 Tax=Cordylochernes scorpioides TaxID=51811 RepID=A0ABY6LF89_9ARAC|nr:hypothetical protein LAZ67_17001132 [Cordylochernes scorpioides]